MFYMGGPCALLMYTITQFFQLSNEFEILWRQLIFKTLYDNLNYLISLCSVCTVIKSHCFQLIFFGPLFTLTIHFYHSSCFSAIISNNPSSPRINPYLYSSLRATIYKITIIYFPLCMCIETTPETSNIQMTSENSIYQTFPIYFPRSRVSSTTYFSFINQLPSLVWFKIRLRLVYYNTSSYSTVLISSVLPVNP